MKTINLISVLALLATVVVLALTLVKVDKKEGYCVDISGGFKPPCNCTGYNEKF